MKVVLPGRFEYGMKILWHAPAVHAIEGPKVVYHEPGDEALYPSAIGHIQAERHPDDAARRNHYSRDAEYVARIEAEIREEWPDAEIVKPTADWPREYFVPEPWIPQGIECDVVVSPRKREYGSTRNWDAWPEVVERLKASGLRVFAVGAEETSYDVDCPAAWDYDRFGDASIEAMHSASLVLATDSGNANLAVLCGRPLLMVTYRGLIGPGPVLDQHGKAMEPHYWPPKMERYEKLNHTGSPISLVDGWEHPERVVDAVVEWFTPEPAA